jgi:hypothetical protein
MESTVAFGLGLRSDTIDESAGSKLKPEKENGISLDKFVVVELVEDVFFCSRFCW